MKINAILIILALFILPVLAENPLIGLLLGGLLFLVWRQVYRVETLTDRLTMLEQQLAQQEKSETFAVKPAQPVTQTSPVKNTAQAKPVAESILPKPAITATLVVKNPQNTTPETSVQPFVKTPTPEQFSEPATLFKQTSATKTVATRPSNPQPQVRPQIQTPKAPIKPAELNFIEKAIQYAWRWLTDGNIFVRAGIVILFIGMTFLIRYAINEDWIPIEMRLAAVCALAISLLGWGWQQRERKRDFSLVMQGGGIGLLYLTIFAGFNFYRVIPSGLAFSILSIIVILAAALAVIQDAKPLALAATVGGFLAPVLTSSGSNNYIGLFSYYALLNLGILAIAWFKSWRILNFVGYIFTFAISTTWGVLSYKAEYFSTTEPFLIFFFLLYVAIGILFAHNRTAFYKDYIDSSIIFGTPLLAFGLQCALVKDFEYGIAISAAVLGFFYLLLAVVIWKKTGERLRLLSETFLSLGVIFATLAIPFAIDGTLTGAIWAIEGLGILWVSLRQQQKYRKLFGVGLIFFSGLMLASEVIFPVGAPKPIFNYAFVNSLFIGCLIIAFSSSASSWLLSKSLNNQSNLDQSIGDQNILDHKLSGLLFVFGLIMLLAGFEYQIFDFLLYTWHGNALAALSIFSVLAYSLAATNLEWPIAHRASCGFILPILVAALLSYAYQDKLAQHYGYLIWPITLLIYFVALKKALQDLSPKILMAAHLLCAAVITCLLYWEGLWQLLLGYSLLAIVFNLFGKKQHWPQLKILALGFLPILVICSIGAIAIDGDLISLSSNAAEITSPFPPGYLLWPLGFSIYFYLLHQNPLIAGRSTRNLHYAGAALIGCLLLWLGLWPLLMGASLLCLLATILWRNLEWVEMRTTALALLPIMLLVFFIKLFDNNFDPFYLQGFNLAFHIPWELGYVLWPLSLSVMFWSLYQCDKHQQPAPLLQHIFSILLPILLVTWEVSWHLLDIVDVKNAWHLGWLPLMAMSGAALIIKPICWPFTLHKEHHQMNTLWPLTLALIGFSLFQLTSSGESQPLPWLPLINAIDIVQCIILFGFWGWSHLLFTRLLKTRSRTKAITCILAFVFLWINVELLRAIHHWGGIAWRLPDIISADISQTTLSLFWAISGLATSIFASKKQIRKLWIIGVTLLGIVVIKLFLVDLAAKDTVERIVSFSGVGILLVLVGYFSPLPPKLEFESETRTQTKTDSTNEH